MNDLKKTFLLNIYRYIYLKYAYDKIIHRRLFN